MRESKTFNPYYFRGDNHWAPDPYESGEISFISSSGKTSGIKRMQLELDRIEDSDLYRKWHIEKLIAQMEDK